MKRLLLFPSLVVACAALAASCGSKPAEEAAATQTAPPPAQASGPAEATPAADKPVEITEDLVLKYMEYQKENFALVAKYVEQSRKNLESAKGDTLKTLNQIGISEQLNKEMEAALAAKRTQLGLDDAEFAALSDAVETIANARMLYNQMGGDAQIAKMQAEQKAAIAALPADKRQEAEAEWAKMSRGITDLRDGADVRKKYGDKSAEAILKHADTLARQRLEVLSLMGKK